MSSTRNRFATIARRAISAQAPLRDAQVIIYRLHVHMSGHLADDEYVVEYRCEKLYPREINHEDVPVCQILQILSGQSVQGLQGRKFDFCKQDGFLIFVSSRKGDVVGAALRLYDQITSMLNAENESM